MRIPARISSMALVMAVLTAGVAHADPKQTASAAGTSAKAARAQEPKALSASARMAALRDNVRDLDARAKAMRARVERMAPRSRGDSPRILAMVEQQQAALAQRLEILQAAAPENGADEGVLREMEVAYEGADKLLAMVERWLLPRRA